MRSLIFNHIENAAESLRANRMRTTLTMLGVTIGVASITLILALSAGATKVITDQVDDLGGTIAVIRPGAPVNTNLENLAAPLYHSYATSSLTEQDLKIARDTEGVAQVAPLMLVGGGVRAEDQDPLNVPIVATTPALAEIAQLPVRDGQFLDDTTDRDTAVIGTQLSIDLFGTEQSIGQTFTVRNQSFTVIGILKRTNRPINYHNIDFDRAAIISLESGKTFNQGVAQLQQINVKATDTDSLPDVQSALKTRIAEAHHGEQDFTIASGKDLSRPASELFYAIAATLTAVAGISLLVGGIGIMNIMLVSVAERTREIGIRKALGASATHITAQFLIESLAISLGGGLFGLALGYGLAFIVSSNFLTFDPLFSWTIAGVAMAISIGVGTLFGLYPAIRAARKDPIVALRQYH